MNENEATETILKIANEKKAYHAAELKRWEEIERLAIELNKHYEKRNGTQTIKPEKKKYKTHKIIKADNPANVVKDDKPKIILYVEKILEKEKHILNAEELYEKVNKEFNENYTSWFSFQSNLSMKLKQSEEYIKKYKAGMHTYYGLAAWFDGDMLLKKYMKPDNEEPDKITEGFCEKCQQHFGNLAKHNEIRHSKPELNEKSLQKEIIPNSMRN